MAVSSVLAWFFCYGWVVVSISTLSVVVGEVVGILSIIVGAWFVPFTIVEDKVSNNVVFVPFLYLETKPNALICGLLINSRLLINFDP